ncbi:MAG: hypothetical protein M1828_005959 [Chrysothrix sp. TS-e1954]|nr:MAG: hypothetical protein M1828_005959 [Chrysothrix sp. TS-e1954]
MASMIHNSTSSVPSAQGLLRDLPDGRFSTMTYLLPTVMALGFLAFLSHTPNVPKGVPDFTAESWPILGSYRFFTHKLSFWKKAVSRSKTGMFSFWLGKNHVVGVSGEAARKMYLENHYMDHIKGVVLIGHGPDYIDGTSTIQHGIWMPTLANGRSWAQRRLLELQRTPELAKRMPKVTRDCQQAFKSVMEAPHNGIINPARFCFSLVATQTTRLVGSDLLVDDPRTKAELLKLIFLLQITSSCHLLSMPWFSYFSPKYWKRIHGREGLRKLVKPLVEERTKLNAPRYEDALQHFVDQGDSKEYIIQFLISMIFIAQANGGVIAGAMLYSIAHHPYWQDRIYNEIKATAAARAQDKNASIVEQLNSFGPQDWENMSAGIDMCYKECIRMWVAFPMGRLNEGEHDIKIPNTNQIIPAGGLACYNTIDVHYNDKLYPKPLSWDPARFGEGREEMKQEAHGFMGWGAGRHPCNGMKWAKLQQNMILAYAFAMYEFSGCHKDGSPNPEFIPPTTALNELAPALPHNLLIKAVPRKA